MLNEQTLADPAPREDSDAGSLAKRALLLPNEPRLVTAPAQIAHSTRHLLHALAELEAYFLGLRALVDPQLQASQPVKLGKPYPVGQCLEITLAVEALLRDEKRLFLSGPAAAGEEAFRAFRRAGGLFRQVWGDLRGQFFQNAFQLGTLYVDVSNDTVTPSKPKVEIRPFDQAGFTAVGDFHHFVLLGERYWQGSFQPNHVLPALAPWFPLVYVSPHGVVALCDITNYMVAVATASAFRASEDMLQRDPMKQNLFDHVARAMGDIGAPLPATPAEGRRLALLHCRDYRRRRFHAAPGQVGRFTRAGLDANHRLAQDFRDRGPFGSTAASVASSAFNTENAAGDGRALGESMTNWTSGYVTDLGYTHGFYRELTPQVQAFSALTKGADSRPASTDRPAFCELGCGQGFSTNLLAAANPDIDFFATDFNPAQIAGAQRLADAAGTKNVRFFDDSFAQFDARNDLPQFDVIALHGIYSWIDKEHRDTIVRFIDKRLKPGGLVYISYNCLPGWSGPSPLRQLLRLAGDAAPGAMPQKIEAGLAFLERMQAAKARWFSTVPGIAERIERLKGQNRNYLAHEYMNADWTLFYHSDVAQDLAAARLSFVGSAHLLDHVDAVNLTADQQAILGETADPVFRETLRDYMVNQQFRRDIFARGALPLSPGEAREIWLDSRFALSTPRGEVPLKVTGALGEATLQEDVYAPVLDALAKPVDAGRSAAISLRQLLSDNPKLADLGWARIQQAILVLVGAGHVQPCPADAKGESKRRDTARRFNMAVMEKARHSADLQFLASPVTGGGLAVDRFQQLFLLALSQNDKDPARFVWRVLDAQGQRIVKDGKALEGVDDNVAELAARYAAFEARLPTLKSLGIV